MYKFPGEKDFRPFLTRIKEGNPDVIFAAGYYNEAASIVRQAKELVSRPRFWARKGLTLPSSLKLPVLRLKGSSLPPTWIGTIHGPWFRTSSRTTKRLIRKMRTWSAHRATMPS